MDYMCKVAINQRKANMENDPVMPILRRLKIGETHSWDKKRANTIWANKRIVELQKGVKFVSRTSEEKIYVTRTK